MLGLLSLLVATGCGAVMHPDEGRVRVQNASTTDFDGVVVGFPEETVDYGRLDAGEASDYRTVPLAYRYARVDAVVGSDTLVLQPIDYVGETPLKNGDYTYVLELETDAGARRLHLRLAEE